MLYFFKKIKNPKYRNNNYWNSKKIQTDFQLYIRNIILYHPECTRYFYDNYSKSSDFGRIAWRGRVHGVAWRVVSMAVAFFWVSLFNTM